MLPVEQPFKTYTDLNGKPLDSGYVYFGQPDQNPITAPVTVYWDADGTLPAAQPLRTVNGYIVNDGTPANVFFSAAYSELVQDKHGVQVFYARSSDDFSIATTIFNYIANVASDIGASLIGFIQAGMGAVLQTLQAKNRRVVDPEDFGAVGDGVTDDAAAIQAAINSFSGGASCSVRLTPGKTYRIASSITTNNRSVVVDGNNAILLIGANMTCGLQVIGTNCEVRNLQINLSAGITVTAGVYVTGLQHVLRNITSRDQIWPTFILCQDMKESHIENLRVDNDVTNKTGIVVQFDYCVNNTLSNSMVGFCAQAFYGSSTAQPVSGYHNEGILFNNVITVYAGTAVNFDNGTFIAISNCCFDFTETIGVFMSNGTDLTVSNTWVASNTTDGFIGIGTLAAVDGVSVQQCTFVRGAAAIAGTVGVSLPGPNVLVIGNRFKSGMNGGVVTQATSQVVANNVSGGGTNIVANLSNATILGGLSVASGLTVTTGTLTVGTSVGIYPTGVSGSATLGASGALPAQVAGYATVVISGTTYKIPYYNT